jgi:hypothetical protein
MLRDTKSITAASYIGVKIIIMLNEEDGCEYFLRMCPEGGHSIVISSQVLFTMEVYYTESSIHNA